MLKKIIGIKNVGRFAECGSHGDVEFRQKTYLFAENGRGKSTLCAILRSLQSGNGSIIEGRKRLGQPDAPEVTLRLEARTASYRAGRWDAPFPDLMVFDQAFVHENVFSGDLIDHGHRRNLHRVIVGREGVALAQEVERLDGLSREAARDLTNRRAALELLAPRSVTLAAFTSLPPISDVADRIAAQEQVLAAATQAANRANEIRIRPGLGAVTLPEFPLAEGELAELLAAQVAEIARDVQTTVRNHLANHTRQGAERWLAEGQRIQQGDECPYCGQGVAGLPLVEAYGVLFGDAYANLQRRATAARADLNRQMGGDAVRAALEVFSRNERLNEFWRPLVGTDLPAGTLAGDARDAFAEWHAATDELLAAKLAAPFERLELSPRFTAARDRCRALADRLAAYNAAVSAANVAIDTFKARIPAEDVAAARTALENLRIGASRHDARTVAVVGAFQTAETTKTRLEGEKATAKAALDAYSADVFARYQSRINELLVLFGAGFKISHTDVSYAGGRPSSSYRVVINDVAVALGDGDTPESTPSFANTLSGGDRSALAFAFFVAQAERDPGLANLTLVFDDPYSSQDRSRQMCTQQILVRLAARAKQLVVLSHNPHFLRLLWQNSEAATTRLLQFGRIGPQTFVAEWDVEAETQSGYERDYGVVRTYATEGTGDPRLVARTIRVRLESYLRQRFIGQFLPNEWLGDFIAKIRTAPAGSPLLAAQPAVAELGEINDFAKRYHHASNPAADAEPLDPVELQVFARRTFAFVGGI